MKSNKKNNKKTPSKVAEKKNLLILNQGDSVIIKNRSAIASGACGVILIIFCIAGTILLKDLWNLLAFKLVFPLVVLGALWNSVGAMLGKVLLDSPNKLMIVYNPIKKQYSFDEINYIDLKSKKEKGGLMVHTVTVYIGDGKRTVEITSFSHEQADELTSLLRGMLDNGAMEYPEGDEEPFNFDSEKKEKRGLFSFCKRKDNKEADASEKDSELSSPEVTSQAQSDEAEKTPKTEKDEASKSENG